MQRSDPSTDTIDPAGNLSSIKEEIEKALSEAGRAAGAVTVTAVSKQHDATRIVPLLEAGHRVFGENRVQEAAGKWPRLRRQYTDIELRFVGPLQSNKAAEAVALFDVIETVDRPKIAAALAREFAAQGRRPHLLVQINTGEEPQKAGVLPGAADAFIKQCRSEFGLEIAGLMCIPPANEAPAPHFAFLAKIAKRQGLEQLSMGMSADYAVAVRLGATHIRVGAAIFGARIKR